MNLSLRFFRPAYCRIWRLGIAQLIIGLTVFAIPQIVMATCWDGVGGSAQGYAVGSYCSQHQGDPSVGSCQDCDDSLCSTYCGASGSDFDNCQSAAYLVCPY